MSNGSNEGKAIDAVIRRIENRDGLIRGNDERYPEREQHPAKVDFVCSIGPKTYAFEHTLIEPFERQIELQKRAREFCRPIEIALSDTLNIDDSINITIPQEAVLKAKHERARKYQSEIIKWAKLVVPLIPTSRYRSHTPLPIELKCKSLPFDVGLYRSATKGQMRGKCWISIAVSRPVEQTRIERLHAMCEKKYPKLDHWKSTEGATTVLILEDGDIQLSNDQLIWNALKHVEGARTDKPDEVYVVTTTTDVEWYVTCLRRPGKSFFDDGERFWEVPVKVLSDLKSDYER